MADIFISYSRRDNKFVQILYEALRKSKQNTWVDWQNTLQVVDWLIEIYDGIEAATTFIFVISPDSVASKVCRQEIEHAVKYNKRIVPVVCRDVDTTDVHPDLAKLNWIFFRESDDFEIAFQTLITAIDTKSY